MYVCLPYVRLSSFTFPGPPVADIYSLCILLWRCFFPIDQETIVCKEAIRTFSPLPKDLLLRLQLFLIAPQKSEEDDCKRKLRQK